MRTCHRLFRVAASPPIAAAALYADLVICMLFPSVVTTLPRALGY